MTAVGVVTAAFGAVTTTLDAAQRSEQAQTAADHYLALPSDARIAHRIDLLEPADQPLIATGPVANGSRSACPGAGAYCRRP
jgi:hypothetical protein